MVYRSDPRFVVLHAVKIKGFADAGSVVDLTALPDEEVTRRLEEAHKANHATQRQGRISGWTLTPDGQARHAELLDADVEPSDVSETLTAIYPPFSALNSRLKQVCTDWQLRAVGRELVPNQHDDPPYDMP